MEWVCCGRALQIMLKKYKYIVNIKVAEKVINLAETNSAFRNQLLLLLLSRNHMSVVWPILVFSVLYLGVWKQEGRSCPSGTDARALCMSSTIRVGYKAADYYVPHNEFAYEWYLVSDKQTKSLLDLAQPLTNIKKSPVRRRENEKQTPF